MLSKPLNGTEIDLRYAFGKDKIDFGAFGDVFSGKEHSFDHSQENKANRKDTFYLFVRNYKEQTREERSNEVGKQFWCEK